MDNINISSNEILLIAIALVVLFSIFLTSCLISKKKRELKMKEKKRDVMLLPKLSL